MVAAVGIMAVASQVRETMADNSVCVMVSNAVIIAMGSIIEHKTTDHVPLGISRVVSSESTVVSEAMTRLAEARPEQL